MKTAIALSIILCFITRICFSQIIYPMPYHERMTAIKERQERAEKKIQSEEIYDEKNKLISAKAFDKNGNIIHFLAFHKSDYYSQIDDDSIKNKMLKNEWFYYYDAKGSLIKVTNQHDFIGGKSYGTEKSDQKYNALPFVARPWKLKTINKELEWSYKYDSKGNKIEQVGQVLRPEYYFRSNAYLVGDTDAKWKIVFEYDSSGRLVREQDYKPSDAEEPVFNREFIYDQNNNMTEEKVFSGKNIVDTETFSFVYDKKNRLIEKNTLGEKELYSYDEKGNLVTFQDIYLLNGNITNQGDFNYDKQNNVIEEKYYLRRNAFQKNASYSNEYSKIGRIIKRTKNIIADNSKTIIKFHYFD